MTEAAAPVPPASAARQPRWGLGDVLAGYGVGLAGAQLVTTAVLLGSGRTLEDVDDLPLSLVFISQTGLWVGLLGVPLVATRLKGRGIVTDLGLRLRLPDLWRGGALGALVQLIAVPLLYWPILELLDKSSSDLEGPARELTDRAEGALGVVLLILIVGIGAPVVEEVFYRGLFLRALLKRGLPAWAAIAISSTVFGISHLQLLQLPALVLFGITAGALTVRSGRLGPPIAAHLAFNMVTVVALLASW